MSNDNRIQLNQSEAAQFCAACIQAGITPLMIGEPGVGKTTIARDIAKLLGYESCIVVTPTIHGTFDLRGLPFVDGEETKFAPSNILPKSGKHLILIDELADCPIHEQSGFYQLLLEKRIGDFILPEDCAVVGATNDETHGACANPLSTAIKTRVAICYVANQIDQSVSYAISNDWHPLVIGFMRANPDCLDGFDQDDFACGSTGRNLGQLAMLERSGFPSATAPMRALCHGLLGRDYGDRYFAFRSLELPDVGLVFSDPDNAEVCTEKDKQFAFAATIVSGCKTKEDFAAVCQYAQRLDRVERVGLLADCVRKDFEFTTTKAWKDFTAKDGELII